MILNHKAVIEFLVDAVEGLYINGLLGVYELNLIELMSDDFVWT
jgi:hypothetical protein